MVAFSSSICRTRAVVGVGVGVPGLATYWRLSIHPPFDKQDIGSAMFTHSSDSLFCATSLGDSFAYTIFHNGNTVEPHKRQETV